MPVEPMNPAVLLTAVLDRRTLQPTMPFGYFLRAIRDRTVETAVITINGGALTDANFSSATPPAPSGGVNVQWSVDASSPANISAHLTPNAVSNTVLRDSLAVSVLGRSAQTDGDPADLVAPTNTVLGRLAGDLGFTPVANAQLADMPALTLKGNDTASPAPPSDLTRAQLMAMLGRGLVKLTSDMVCTTATLADVSGLAFAVLSGHYYGIRFLVVAQSNTSTAIGVRLGITRPAATLYAATVRGFEASAGTGVEYQAPLINSGDSAAPPFTPGLNVDFLYTVELLIVPSADGTVQLQAAAETVGGTVTIRQGSLGLLQEVF